MNAQRTADCGQSEEAEGREAAVIVAGQPAPRLLLLLLLVRLACVHPPNNGVIISPLSAPLVAHANNRTKAYNV